MARPSRTNTGPLFWQRHARSVATFNPRRLAASASVMEAGRGARRPDRLRPADLCLGPGSSGRLVRSGRGLSAFVATPANTYIDPVALDLGGTQYRLYPTAVRGAGTFGSYRVVPAADYQIQHDASLSGDLLPPWAQRRLEASADGRVHRARGRRDSRRRHASHDRRHSAESHHRLGPMPRTARIRWNRSSSRT